MAIWFFLGELYTLREEYDMLNSNNQSSSGIIANLEARNNSLLRITSLRINSSQTTTDAVAFYSMIRPSIENNNISLLNMITSGQDNDGRKDNILQMKLDGDYYAITRMLAEWRNLPVPSKITRLDLKRNHNLPEELVEIDVTVEVMTED
ncbi:MAG: hypothetical protein IJQ08_10645 [Synergistaceae bacterium]|nr:hypothetical protein [Synergistaceae bacterium]MBR0169119.1 hypothetical protein [Synergistaceae bacterium]